MKLHSRISKRKSHKNKNKIKKRTFNGMYDLVWLFNFDKQG